MTIQGLKLGKGGTRRLNKKLPTTGTPVNGANATSTLSMATKPTATNTVTIGTTVYTFVATPAAVGDVAIGALVANSQANLVAAINVGDDFNDPHPDVAVAAFAANDMVATAKVFGVAGNSIATTETFTASGNVFDEDTLLTGLAGTNGDDGDLMADATYLYFCMTGNVANTTAASWRRVSLGSAY